MNSVRIKNKKGRLCIRGESQVSGIPGSLCLSSISAKGERESEMRPGKQDKKEAASSKNLRDPRGMPHGLSLYSNKAKGTLMSPFWT